MVITCTDRCLLLVIEFNLHVQRDVGNIHSSHIFFLVKYTSDGNAA
jgi:hypothetical protein